jgi:hypothetical protein
MIMYLLRIKHTSKLLYVSSKRMKVCPMNTTERNSAEQPVTSAQLARHLQITTRTLATWRSQGKIPFWRINSRNLRYRIRDVETALSMPWQGPRATR